MKIVFFNTTNYALPLLNVSLSSGATVLPRGMSMNYGRLL